MDVIWHRLCVSIILGRVIYLLGFGMGTMLANLHMCCIMLVCHQYVGSVYIGGYDSLSKSGLCVFGELCPVSFIEVGESPLVCCSL